ncbi:hypothetical protein VUR80DRAFT_4638 [Thermomyces stellatus]
MLECSLLVHSDAKIRPHIHNMLQRKPFIHAKQVDLPRRNRRLDRQCPISGSRSLFPVLPCVPGRLQDRLVICRGDETMYGPGRYFDGFGGERKMREAASCVVSRLVPANVRSLQHEPIPRGRVAQDEVGARVCRVPFRAAASFLPRIIVVEPKKNV